MNTLILVSALFLSIFESNKNGLAERYINQGDKFSDNKQYYISDSLYNKALEIYSNQNDDLKKGILNNRLGCNHYLQADYKTSLDYFRNSLIYKMKSGDSIEIAKTNMNIANVYLQMGAYDLAIIYFKKSYQIFKNEKMIAQICDIQNGIGLSLIYLKNYNQAALYLDSSESIAIQGATDNLFKINVNKVLLQMELRNYEYALELLTSTEKYLSKNDDLAYIYSNKINIFNNLYNFDSATYYYNLRVNLSSKLDIKNDDFIYNLFYSETLMKQNKQNQSLELLRFCIKDFTSKGLYDRLIDCYKLMNTSTLITQIEKLKNENKVQEYQIKLSNLDKERNTIILASSFANEKDLMTLSYQSKLLKYILSISILGMILFFVFIYYRYRLNKRVLLKNKSIDNSKEKFELIRLLIEKDISNCWNRVLGEYYYRKSQIKDPIDFSNLDKNMDQLIQKIELIRALVKS